MDKGPYGVCAVALVIVCTHLVGCSATSSVVSWPMFSPDGAQIAYVWESRLTELVPHGKTWFRTISLRRARRTVQQNPRQ